MLASVKLMAMPLHRLRRIELKKKKSEFVLFSWVVKPLEVKT
jgi:hypothetical protein